MIEFLNKITIAEWKDFATILGAFIALVALAKGIAEYIKQGSQKRADHFFAIRSKLKSNPTFEEICALLEVDDQKLLGISFKDKRSFLGLFEEVALMVNSGFIKRDIAHYMFGYYALRCWDSKHFWYQVNRESIYWSLFKEFVQEMRLIEKNFMFDKSKLRF